MIRYNLPQKSEWKEICKRPSIDKNELEASVRSILQAVKLNGDEALFQYSEKFDNCQLESIEVSRAEIEAAADALSDELKAAIQLAKTNIEIFHRSQQEEVSKIETSPGVECWRKSVGIEKVGLYIPGGTAPCSQRF